MSLFKVNFKSGQEVIVEASNKHEARYEAISKAISENGSLLDPEDALIDSTEVLPSYGGINYNNFEL
jgi:hypothetical protein